MKDEGKSREQLMAELVELRRRNTELEALEAKSRLANKERDRILTLSQDLICIAGMDGFFKYVNPAWQNILGYTSEELLSHRFLDFIHPGDHAESNEEVAKLSAGQPTTDFENRYIHKDGSIRSISWTAITAPDEEIVYCTGRDITDRKLAEKALRDSEEWFRTIVLTAPSLLTITDVNGNNIYVSPNCEEITGYTQEELTGRVIWWVHEDDIPKAKEVFAGAFREGMGGRNFEYKAAKKNGELWYASSSWEPLRDREGKFNGVVFQTTDVTERKRAEEEIRETKETYERLADNADEAVFRVKPGATGARVVYVNPSAERIFGYTQLDWDCDPDLSSKIIHPDYAEKQRQILEEISTIKKPIRHSVLGWIAKDGREITMEYTIIPVIDGEGRVSCFESIGRDITEREQMEKALRESEEKHRTYVENAPYGIFIVDSNGKYVDANPAACLMTGYSREELLSMSVPELASPESRPENLGSFDRLRETGKVQTEVILRRKDGTDFHSSLEAVALSGNRFMAFCSDITERKQAEEMLRESEERLEALLDKSPIPTAVGGSDGAIISFNEALEELIGYGEAEITDVTDWTNRLYPDEEYREFVQENIRQALEGEEQECTEFTITCKDGSTRVVDFHTSFSNDGLIIQMLDITDRKRMEKELLRVEKLESIGVLAGGIAHDLNNLLTAVVGNISLARMYDNPADKDVRLAEAEKASMLIRDLTQQLLTFAKGGAPILETASIAELLRSSATFPLRGSNVRCEFSIPDSLWPAEIDEGQVNQVISNLVINAKQAMPEGGTIQISAENTIIGGEYVLPLEPGPYIKVSVEDEGIGVSEEHIQKIFDPFFTTKQAGSGLGLATSYSIIEKHNGYITAESQLGVGTKFHTYLPASPDGVLPAAEEEEKKPIMGKGRVLVVDDEKHVRDTAAEMLGSIGYKITIALDGTEAIEVYRQAKDMGLPYDAVIIDLTIPGGMGGGKTIRQLIELDPEVKAIVSSGYSNDPIMADFGHYGFKGVIAKPYRIRELSEVLHKVIVGT